MSGIATKKMLEMYEQNAETTLFLSGYFRTPRENFYDSETVEIDIERDDEDISIVIQDMSTGHRLNTADLYTNKEFKAPVHKEAIQINSYELIKRMPGENPFQEPQYRANLIVKMMKGMRKVERKIRRAIELQAAQILQSGAVDLKNESGTTLYTLDFKAKASHFPTAGTAWNAAGADPINDLLTLMDIIRNDGLADPNQIIMGEKSFEAFVSNEKVQKRLDIRRAELGAIVPMRPNVGGGNYRGTVEVGNYKLDVWTYGGRYKDPQNGNKVKYLGDDKVIVRASSGRMDATFGNIPHIGSLLGMTNNLVPELPSRMSSAGTGIDLIPRVWISQDGETLFGGVGSRPLLIPVAIDTYGCLTTGV